MGGAMSRNKGAGGEREVVKLLQPILDRVHAQLKLDYTYLDFGECPMLQRNTLQSDRGGFDIVGTEWLALEVKRQEVLCLPEWWKQTVQQAKQHQTPVLIYRRNGYPWRVRMLLRAVLPDWMGGGIDIVSDISIEDFLIYFGKRAYDEIGNQHRNSRTWLKGPIPEQAVRSQMKQQEENEENERRFRLAVSVAEWSLQKRY